MLCHETIFKNYLLGDIMSDKEQISGLERLRRMQEEKDATEPSFTLQPREGVQSDDEPFLVDIDDAVDEEASAEVYEEEVTPSAPYVIEDTDPELEDDGSITEDVSIDETKAVDSLPLLTRINILEHELIVLGNVYNSRKETLDELQIKVGNLTPEEAYENRCKSSNEGNNCQYLEGHSGKHMAVWYVFTKEADGDYRQGQVEWD